MVEKTVKEMSDAVIDAHKSIRAIENELRERVVDCLDFIKKFHRENSFYDDKVFGWADLVSYPSINSSTVTEEGIYFYNFLDGSEPYDDVILTYDEMENISALLEASFIEFKAEKAKRESDWKNNRRRKLEEELSKLNENS